ncbi:DoxX family protein [Nocardia sp. NPDC057455]|uniref:DoxX family protein n=1 Tax=Nocardia sp. NPDC057455 TaxID=3346138 RepID=UPI00366DA0E7
MNIVTALVAGVLAFAVAGSAAATLARQPKLVGIVAAVGFPVRRMWMLGVVKLAAAFGLVCGLLWPPLAVAAAIGLVVYFCAAIGMHLRMRQRDIAAPAVFLFLSVVTSLLLAVGL